MNSKVYLGYQQNGTQTSQDPSAPSSLANVSRRIAAQNLALSFPTYPPLPSLFIPQSHANFLARNNGVFIKLTKATGEMLKIVEPYIAYGTSVLNCISIWYNQLLTWNLPQGIRLSRPLGTYPSGLPSLVAFIPRVLRHDPSKSCLNGPFPPSKHALQKNSLVLKWQD